MTPLPAGTKAVTEAPKAADVVKAKAEAGSSKVVSELTIQTSFRIQENYESMLQPRRSSRRPSQRPQRPSQRPQRLQRWPKPRRRPARPKWFQN